MREGEREKKKNMLEEGEIRRHMFPDEIIKTMMS